ncbi:hypothetical protein O181_041774 [Austropuccinia psidii MF-1]|uniref:Uncharacterized protein n=1 Tax=Austropuccinia psidii MF-1 TaxID=1389203 RepID=A0A9Q3HGU2_9BASI|nr:hypothetical protein [Austropuccinia psidii MF-1]
MPVQHSPPAKNTRSQTNPAVLTPTARDPLDSTPSVHQLSANLDRGPPMEREAPSRRGGMKSRRSRSFSGLLDEEEEESVEEEDSGETEVADAFANAPEVPQGSNLTPTTQPPVSQSDPSLLQIMEQMATIMGQFSQEAAPRDNSNAPSFKTPSMKAPDPFDGTQAHKLRGFIQSCKLIFRMIQKMSSLTERKFCTKLLVSPGELENGLSPTFQIFPMMILPTSSIIGSYLKPNYSPCLVTTMKTLMAIIGDWGERAYIHVYRRGLASRPLDQLAPYPGNFDTLQELMDITLEFDISYYERQKEKVSHQEKKPPVTGSNSSMPPQDSYPKRPHHKKNKKGKQFQVLKDTPHSALLNKNNKLIGSVKERRIKEGLCTYFGGKHPIEKCFKRPQNKPGSSRGFPSKKGKALVGIMMCSMALTYFSQEKNCAL